MAGTLLNASGFFDYHVSIGPWFRSYYPFMPDPSLMEGVPFMFKFHVGMDGGCYYLPIQPFGTPV